MNMPIEFALPEFTNPLAPKAPVTKETPEEKEVISRVEYAVPAMNALVRSTSSMREEANSLVVDSDSMEEIAVANTAFYMQKLKIMDEQRLSVTRPIDAAKKAVMDIFRGPREALVEAIEKTKAAILVWEEKKAALAKAQQLEEERKAKEAAAQIQAQAEALMESGQTEAAEVLTAQAEMVSTMAPATSLSSAKLSVSGLSRRSTSGAEVYDFPAFVMWVANNLDYVHCLQVNQAALNLASKAMNGNLKANGVREFKKKSLGVRAAA